MTSADPRIERTRQHVLACARELLLAEGAEAVTFSALARQAQVSRNTLYRHWATPEQLLVDLTLEYYVTRIDDTVTPAGIPEFLHGLRKNLATSETASVLTALIARAERDAGTAAALQRLAAVRKEALARITGPLSDAQFAALIGPLFYQAFVARGRLDEAFVDELVALTTST
ncbi:TetR/AcrR family transcriptional regulator [Kribbella sp. NPDC051620]|uniref:TetR/AcrR family transcriptional regulator n=1 Tax=Kribbella sp. NPDC051620 TaxID=3364120 RepID=UPI0037B20F54